MAIEHTYSHQMSPISKTPHHTIITQMTFSPQNADITQVLWNVFGSSANKSRCELLLVQRQNCIYIALHGGAPHLEHPMYCSGRVLSTYTRTQIHKYTYLEPQWQRPANANKCTRKVHRCKGKILCI